MQQPTLTNTRLRSTNDAHLVIHAARLGLLRIVDRRLDAQERAEIRPGHIYVWEERGTLDLGAMGIERWTDGIRWGPSRLRHEFLFYQQRDEQTKEKHADGFTSKRRGSISNSVHVPYSPIDELDRLVKQTYSVFVLGDENSKIARTKLHITAYFNRRKVDSLETVEHHPLLRSLVIPSGLYRSARVGHPKSGERFGEDDSSPASDLSPATPDAEGPGTFPPFSSLAPDSPSLSEYAFKASSRSPPHSYQQMVPMISGPMVPKERPASPAGYRCSCHRQFCDGACRRSLPSLHIALSSSEPWRAMQRPSEDDMQLARLDVARALV